MSAPYVASSSFVDCRGRADKLKAWRKCMRHLCAVLVFLSDRGTQVCPGEALCMFPGEKVGGWKLGGCWVDRSGVCQGKVGGGRMGDRDQDPPLGEGSDREAVGAGMRMGRGVFGGDL